MCDAASAFYQKLYLMGTEVCDTCLMSYLLFYLPSLELLYLITFSITILSRLLLGVFSHLNCSTLLTKSVLKRHPFSALSVLTLLLSLYFPFLSVLRPGKWFCSAEWLCKDPRKGFKLSPVERKDTKRKIKKREAEKRFIRLQTPNDLPLCKAMTHGLALYLNV